MTPDDLARLTEEEREWYAISSRHLGSWDERVADSRLVKSLTRLALASAVVEEARRLMGTLHLGIPFDQERCRAICGALAAYDAGLGR